MIGTLRLAQSETLKIMDACSKTNKAFLVAVMAEPDEVNLAKYNFSSLSSEHAQLRLTCEYNTACMYT